MLEGHLWKFIIASEWTACYISRRPLEDWDISCVENVGKYLWYSFRHHWLRGRRRWAASIGRARYWSRSDIQKTLAVLNPFHRKGQIDDASYLLQDSDLAGPVAFCLILAAFLLLAGSKAHFGYVYGLAMTSCILMYILQSLMSSSSNITLSSVASVLGYCLLPVVVLAGFGVFTTLRGPMGLILAVLAVAWASLSASRLFSTMSGEEDQKLLIAYPCLLLYGVFTLIIIF